MVEVFAEALCSRISYRDYHSAMGSAKAIIGFLDDAKTMIAVNEAFMSCMNLITFMNCAGLVDNEAKEEAKDIVYKLYQIKLNEVGRD